MVNTFSPPFHQSTIMDFIICRRRGCYAHVYDMRREFCEPNMFFGIVMHKALELLHAGIDYKLADLIDECEKTNDSPVRWNDRDSQIAEWETDAFKILANYWDKAHNREAKILLGEAYFKVNIGPFPFVGRIDQVRLQGAETHLIDFKSGAAPDCQAWRDLDYQLSIYAWACLHGVFWHALRAPDGKELKDDQGRPIEPSDPSQYITIGRIPDKICIYKLQDHLPYKRATTKQGVKYAAGDERGPGRYWTTRSNGDFNAMIRDLGAICRSIVGPHYGTRKLEKGGSFPRSPINYGGLQTCAQCPYQAECLADRNQEILDSSGVESIITEEDLNVAV